MAGRQCSSRTSNTTALRTERVNYYVLQYLVDNTYCLLCSCCCRTGTSSRSIDEGVPSRKPRFLPSLEQEIAKY